MKISKLLNRKRKQRKTHQNIFNSLKNKKVSPLFSGEMPDISPTRETKKKPKGPSVNLDRYSGVANKKTDTIYRPRPKAIVKASNSTPSPSIINKSEVKVIGGKDTLVKEFLTNNIKTILEKSKVVPVLTKGGQKIIETSKVKDFIEKKQNNVLVSYEYGGDSIAPRPGGSLVLAGDGASPEKIVPVSQSNPTNSKVIAGDTFPNPGKSSSTSVQLNNSVNQSTINKNPINTNNTNKINVNEIDNKINRNSELSFMNQYSPTNITPTQSRLNITENKTSTDLINSAGVMRRSVAQQSSAASERMKEVKRKEKEPMVSPTSPSSSGSAAESKPTNTRGSSFNGFLHHSNISLPNWRVRNG